MKNLLSLIAIFSCAVVQTYGQVTVGYRIGKSPAVTPGTNLPFTWRDPFDENLGDMEQVHYAERPFLAYGFFRSIECKT